MPDGRPFCAWENDLKILHNILKLVDFLGAIKIENCDETNADNFRIEITREDMIKLAQPEKEYFKIKKKETEKKKITSSIFPNHNIVVLDKVENRHHYWKIINEYENLSNTKGLDVIGLGKEHIKALCDGKMVAWNDSKYCTFLIMNGLLRKEEKDET